MAITAQRILQLTPHGLSKAISKGDKNIIRSLERARLQAMAMEASLYEIGIIRSAGPGRELQMLTRIWDLDATVKSIRVYSISGLSIRIRLDLVLVFLTKSSRRCFKSSSIIVKEVERM